LERGGGKRGVARGVPLPVARREVEPDGVFPDVDHAAPVSSIVSRKRASPMSHTPSDRRPNRLIHESSPYLLQHAYNPVDWRPWGDEAFAAARAEEKPIFLSVGYSACHWCHVMERESFEDPKIADLMNRYFINVKVDREERPDVDQIYMAAVQALTRHGGWPMSVFLTPDLKPFFGGTYYPPTDRGGMPGFPRVLLSVHEAWVERRGKIEEAAAEVTAHINNLSKIPRGAGGLEIGLIDQAAMRLEQAFDRREGGFGSAPKFPHPMDLMLLLRNHYRTNDERSLGMVELTLDKMARGGIYDHLGGGFARYSTDERWLVPHFEKMLYDNALLTSVYLQSYQITNNPERARVARETIEYILNRMTSPDGAFYSTEDADSEGVEGKYYVWTLGEIESILGADRARMFASVYDVSERGNWDGVNILNTPKPIAKAAAELGIEPSELELELARSRELLLKEREKRVPPGKDEKILASWNGLMIGPLAEASRILGEPRYLAAARRAAGFILEKMTDDDGNLFHVFGGGIAKIKGCLDEYAYMIDGLTRLFECGGGIEWLAAAIEFAERMIADFADREDGGFYYTGVNHERLISRQKDVYDNATPASTATAATALIRLGAITGRDDFSSLARGTLFAVQAVMEHASPAAAQSLIALDLELAATRETVVFSGEDDDEFESALDAIHARFDPRRVVAPQRLEDLVKLVELTPLAEGRSAIGGKVTTYICENHVCRSPILGLEALKAEISAPR
jgi:uncharacterized protein YyaL (SSP411 family)